MAAALVVVNVMTHNKSSDDDAILEATLLLGDGVNHTARAKESMVQDFVPVAVKAHGIESLRLVFEIPRSDVGDQFWQRVPTADVKLQLTTLRGQRKSIDIRLADTFMQQFLPGPNLRMTLPPPIRGYTEVRLQSGVLAEQTYFGTRPKLDDHELW